MPKATSQGNTRVRRGFLRHGAGAAVAIWALGAGCAGVVSAPRYTDAPQAEVVRDLMQRQTASSRRLLRVVDRYMGIPYRWGGTTQAGMDCSAFVRAIFRETYGIELPRTSRQMYRLGESVPDPKALSPGDLVFFYGPRGGSDVSHVGIYMGNGLFAHVSSSSGGTLSRLSAEYYSHHYAGARRIRR